MRVRRGGGCGCALGEPDTDADADADADDAGAETETEADPVAPEQWPLANGAVAFAGSRTRSLALALATSATLLLLPLLLGMAPTLSSVASDWDREISSVISCATSLSVSPVSRRLLLATTLEDSSPVMVLLEMLVTLPVPVPVPVPFLPVPLPAAASAAEPAEPATLPLSLQQRFGED